MNTTDPFRAAMRRAGLDYVGPILNDGKLHRFKAGDDSKRNSWYVLFPGPPMAGAFGCWKRGRKEIWHERNGTLSQSEWDDVRQRHKDADSILKSEIEARQKKARTIAAWIIARSKPVTTHPYLTAKKVQAYGDLREYRGSLVVPLSDAEGELHSLQFISADGTKYFLTGGRVQGCFFALALEGYGPLLICEGYATGATIRAATGYPVICAMNCGNLGAVGGAERKLWSQREIIIAADNDQWTEKPKTNPGVTQATAVARAIRALLVVPQFQDTANKPTDFNDLAAGEGLAAVTEQIDAAIEPAETDETTCAMKNADEKDKWIRFYTPSECRNYVPLDGHILVGDCHIVRGAVTVIGGPPGVGKSRAGIALAMAGATGQEWCGRKVHCRFKTLVIQNENGRYRLSKDFAEVQGNDLDNFIRISEPPANGMAFDRPEFRAALALCIQEFKPDVIILDPWNSAARDDRQKDYLETFQTIREVLPKGDNAPALVIVAHTRKPRVDERASGRTLLNLLAGSYVLGSVPRSVFVMQPASDDTEDERIVWTCCKNNDGELGPRSAWYRRNGIFEPCSDFDWKIFDNDGEKRRAVTLQDMETLFESGGRKLAKSVAVSELQELTDLGKTACYEALKLEGKFAGHLEESDGLILFKP